MPTQAQPGFINCKKGKSKAANKNSKPHGSNTATKENRHRITCGTSLGVLRARKERAVSMKTNTYNEFKSAPTSSAADHALPPLALVRRRLAPGLATSSSAIFSFSWMRANLDSLGSLGFLGFSHAIFYWILACDLLLDFLDFLESAIFCISWISWILACDRVYGNIPTQTDTTHARTRANERTLQQGS